MQKEFGLNLWGNSLFLRESFKVPTVFYRNGFRFYFWSEEGKEPAHIHVNKGNGTAKYWLVPEIECEFSYGFKLSEERYIRATIKKEYKTLISAWNEYNKRKNNN